MIINFPTEHNADNVPLAAEALTALIQVTGILERLPPADLVDCEGYAVFEETWKRVFELKTKTLNHSIAMMMDE